MNFEMPIAIRLTNQYAMLLRVHNWTNDWVANCKKKSWDWPARTRRPK